MNAIQFIKDHGVEKASEVVATCHGIPYYTFKEKTEHGYSACKSVDLVDLKRLVESVELIEKLGGIESAKSYVPDQYKSERLKQAIADYESIGGEHV